MANDFGLRVGVDGEAEFKKALKEINAEIKELNTEAKLVASQYDRTDKSTEALTEKSKALTKQIDEQKKKIDFLSDALENAKEQYGENSIQAKHWQSELNNAQAQVNNLTRNLDKMEKAIEDANKAEKEGTDATGEYGKSLKGTTQSASEAGTAASGMSISFAAAAAAIVAAIGAIVKASVDVGKATVKLTLEAAEYADELATQAKVTGISTQKLQEYGYAAKLVDVSVETITSSMRKNIMSMQQAQRGVTNYVAAYEQLGVSVVDKNGKLRDSEEVYWDVIDALGRMENLTERDATAMQLLGRSAQDVNPLIIAGSRAMAEYAKEAHEVGYVLSDETLRSYNDTQDAIDKLENSVQAAKNAIAAILMPVLGDLADKGSEHLGKFTKAVQEANGDVEKIGQAIKDTIPDAISDFMDRMPEIVDLAMTAVGTFIGAVAEKLPDVAGNIISGIPWGDIGFAVSSALLGPFGHIANAAKAIQNGKGEDTSNYTSADNDARWAEMTANQREQNELLKQIAEKETVVAIGDEEIGRANARWQNSYGSRVTGGGYD